VGLIESVDLGRTGVRAVFEDGSGVIIRGGKPGVRANGGKEVRAVRASARQMEGDLRGVLPAIGRLVDELLAIARDLHCKRLVFKSIKPWTLSSFYLLWFS